MCTKCSWEEFLDDLEDIVSDARYEWAISLIDGIYKTVEDSEHVSTGQKKAIENIKDRVEHD